MTKAEEGTRPDAESEDAAAPPDAEHVRMVEALLFAAVEPLDEASIAARLPDGADVAGAIGILSADYARRGVQLKKIGRKWAFRTAPDLSFLLRRETEDERRLSRAATETLAIIAYHQPMTRAEIEDIRGVSVSKGTLDVLIEAGWVRPMGRRRSPGRPVTYGTTEAFLDHFGFASLKDLPGIAELKAAGLLDSRIPDDFQPAGPGGDAFLPLDADTEDVVPNPLHEDLDEEIAETDSEEDGDPDEPKAGSEDGQVDIP